jgi:predicted  nucleic acid-binding Zn-ribbon protein
MITKTRAMKELNQLKMAIAKNRDDLVELRDEIDTMSESSDRAIEALEDAIQYISEFV